MILSPLLRHSLKRSRTFRLHLRNWSDITIGSSALTLHSLEATFPYVWLRDSCQSSPECIHPTTSQKLHKSSDIPPDIKPVKGGVHLSPDGIDVEWEDGHKSHFTTSFLERYSSPAKLTAFHREVVRQTWNNEIITKTRDLFVSYESLKTPTGLLAALTQLARYGLMFVNEVPYQKTSDETCELPTLAGLFGDIRTTFYGRLWDVMNVRDSKNVAYTNLDLGLHMDL
ncbi:hypothetical protein C0991_009868, partial [Blastosporella zonata]